MIVYVMDSSDVLGAFGRSMFQTRSDLAKTLTAPLVIISWYNFRLFAYPVIVYYGAFKTTIGPDATLRGTNEVLVMHFHQLCLCLLHTLNMIWCYKLGLMAIAFVSKGETKDRITEEEAEKEVNDLSDVDN